MSWEATYNPNDPAVPNIVTAWNEVDLPTGVQYTINNPNTDAVNGIVTPGTCVVDLINSTILPLTDAQATRVRLFQNEAGQPKPFGIETFIWKGIASSFQQTILKGIVKGIGMRFFSETNIGEQRLLLGETYNGTAITIMLTKSGYLSVHSSDGQTHEVYLDIIYS